MPETKLVPYKPADPGWMQNALNSLQFDPDAPKPVVIDRQHAVMDAPDKPYFRTWQEGIEKTPPDKRDASFWHRMPPEQVQDYSETIMGDALRIPARTAVNFVGDTLTPALTAVEIPVRYLGNKTGWYDIPGQWGRNMTDYWREKLFPYQYNDPHPVMRTPAPLRWLGYEDKQLSQTDVAHNVTEAAQYAATIPLFWKMPAKAQRTAAPIQAKDLTRGLMKATSTKVRGKLPLGQMGNKGAKWLHDMATKWYNSPLWNMTTSLPGATARALPTKPGTFADYGQRALNLAGNPLGEITSDIAQAMDTEQQAAPVAASSRVPVKTIDTDYIGLPSLLPSLLRQSYDKYKEGR